MENITLFETSVYADAQIDTNTAREIAKNISNAVAGVLRAAGVESNNGVITLTHNVTIDELGNETNDFQFARSAGV